MSVSVLSHSVSGSHPTSFTLSHWFSLSHRNRRSTPGDCRASSASWRTVSQLIVCPSDGFAAFQFSSLNMSSPS